VFKYDGIVDKYIGDAIMAVFGTLEEEYDAEYRAVSAAIEFQRAIADMNEERIRARKEPISIGVGVNTGTFYLCRSPFGRLHWFISTSGVYLYWRYSQYLLSHL
jgi:class 3 adenylate cyclase